VAASVPASGELDTALLAARAGDGAAFARLVRWCEAEAFRVAAGGNEDLAAAVYLPIQIMGVTDGR